MGANVNYLTSLNFVCKIYEIIVLFGLLIYASIILTDLNNLTSGECGSPCDAAIWSIITSLISLILIIIFSVAYIAGVRNTTFRVIEIIFVIILALNFAGLGIFCVTSTVDFLITLLVFVLFGILFMDVMCKIYEWSPLGDFDYEPPDQEKSGIEERRVGSSTEAVNEAFQADPEYAEAP